MIFSFISFAFLAFTLSYFATSVVPLILLSDPFGPSDNYANESYVYRFIISLDLISSANFNEFWLK